MQILKRILSIAAVLVATAIPSQAANICVTGASPVGGSCDSTVADFAAAITAATYGDTIYLHAGTTYTGHWTLPDKGAGSTFITIRSDAANSSFPGANERLDPEKNPALLAFLPKLAGDSTSNPTIKVAPSAHHYRFLFLEFTGNPLGYQEMMYWGGNGCDPSPGVCQEYESQEPTDLEADRIYMHGSKIAGQKRGITVGGKRFVIKNSTIIDMAGLGQDAQAIGGSNGHGPLTIINNRLEASTENILIGGDDPHETTFMQVTGTPTTTSASVTVQPGRISTNTHTLSELFVGQPVAVLVGGGTDRAFTVIRSITGTGTTGSITFDAIPSVPDVPGDIRGGVVLKGMTVRYNYFSKPLSYLNPIINSATGVNATASTAAGSLAAGTYSYTVQAINKDGYTGNIVYSAAPAQVTATLGATGQVILTWTPASVTNASHYRIYGRAATPTAYWEVTVGTNTFTDTGAAGTATTSVPKASFWQIKNLFEIKAAQNVQMDSNILEYSWTGSDAGFALWIKSVNQGLRCEFCQSRDIVIEKNIIRHVSGALSISGSEFSGGTNADRVMPLTNFTFRNNLIYDSTSEWAVSKGAAGNTAYAINYQNWSVNTVIDHNTIIHTPRGFGFIGGKSHENLIITNNMGIRGSNGLFADAFGEGTVGLAGRTTSYTMTKNAIAGITLSKYPAGNYGPTQTAWEAEFVNYTVTGAADADGPADFKLRDDSTYHNQATDGTDLGADVTAVLAATATVLTGGAASSSAPPTITTTTLPSATVGTAYSQTLTGSGTGALTWAVTTGSLPAGLTLTGATGVIAGTPTTAGTVNFTVTVTDAATSLTAAQPLTIVVNASLVPVSITTSSPLPGVVIGNPYTTTIVASDGRTPYAWDITSGALPAGVTLNAATGIIFGTPTALGTFTPTIRVTDATGGTASKAFSLTVSAETPISGRPTTTGPIPQQLAAWSGTTAPTLSTPGCCRISDEWSDTSTSPPTKKQVISLSPLTWGIYSGSTTHNLLSLNHGDTAVDAVQDGDTIIGTNGKWTRLGIGPGGTVLGSDGTGVNWVPQTLTLPATISAATRVEAPIIGVNNYIAFSPVTSPGCSASNFGRVFYDTADNKLKACEGPAATPVQVVGGSATTRPIDIMIHSPTSVYTSWGAALPSTTQELANSPRFRVKFDMTSGFTQARLTAKIQTACNASAVFAVQYSTDETTWLPLDGGSGPSVPCDNSNVNISSWVNITAGAKADVFLRVVGVGGNSTTTPTFGAVHLQLK